MADAANPGEICAEIAELLSRFAERVQDASEGLETFLLFSQDRHQHDLGMVDPSAVEITVTVAGKDFLLTQSPGLLTSTRSGGTTGAAVWKTTALLAEWFACPDNSMFKSGLLDGRSNVLELGAGVAGLLPLVLAPRVSTYYATDQPYALKLLRGNITANTTGTKSSKKPPTSPNGIKVFPLDWELDDLSHALHSRGILNGLDMIIASDCIYNYHLIEPLVDTCARLCEARTDATTPTICLVAQQLREPDVFEQWLTAFAQHFHVWRLDDSATGRSIGPDNGYVVHADADFVYERGHVMNRHVDVYEDVPPGKYPTAGNIVGPDVSSDS
ncbi:Diaminohydroxyphosphoribosylamino-pyrimidine deaminase [Sphaceloma murrayae]|uniref:Diaminohydroxyphosphoribosylamino-pyrimidine deaminase n=1 Tax=Sphaceloma murrayae TaxID=2082308 RepID=A0A2K1QM92_9PEZI|nr:Diaminohydroxyphosphoribosylamino-pyrimidine deaminase [Sphaceloma murrayae]